MRLVNSIDTQQSIAHVHELHLRIMSLIFPLLAFSCQNLEVPRRQAILDELLCSVVRGTLLHLLEQVLVLILLLDVGSSESRLMHFIHGLLIPRHTNRLVSVLAIPHLSGSTV